MVTDLSLKAISDGCQNLTSVNISWCDGITENGRYYYLLACHYIVANIRDAGFLKLYLLLIIYFLNVYLLRLRLPPGLATLFLGLPHLRIHQ